MSYREAAIAAHQSSVELNKALSSGADRHHVSQLAGVVEERIWTLIELLDQMEAAPHPA